MQLFINLARKSAYISLKTIDRFLLTSDYLFVLSQVSLEFQFKFLDLLLILCSCIDEEFIKVVNGFLVLCVLLFGRVFEI